MNARASAASSPRAARSPAREDDPDRPGHAACSRTSPPTATKGTAIAGLNWVASHHIKPAVANLSLGGSANQALDDAVTGAASAGVTVVVAAGNSNADACSYSPARAASALTVGATDSADARASYSNYGSCVDLFAPGSGITSAYHSSDSATASMSGTSMASPHAAGVAALYLQQHPAATPAQVIARVTGAATPAS